MGKIKECVICGTAFELSIGKGNKSITCSEACRKKNRHIWLKEHNWGKTFDYRLLIVHKLGAKCNICGFGDIRALQIDHVKGHGNKDRKESGLDNYRYFKRVWNEVLDGSLKYQILCANCNWIKRFKNKEHNQWFSKNGKNYKKFNKLLAEVKME